MVFASVEELQGTVQELRWVHTVMVQDLLPAQVWNQVRLWLWVGHGPSEPPSAEPDLEGMKIYHRYHWERVGHKG